MQAIRVHRFGGPEVLQVEDVPIPDPGPGEALIKVEAAGINFVDVYHRAGLYPGQLPLTLGREAAGTVERVGTGVSSCRPGDRVVSETVRGAYGQYAVAAADRLVPVPGEVSSRLAAAVLLQGMTAHYLAYATYRLAPGDTCLVHAAAGGVGLLLCQIASGSAPGLSARSRPMRRRRSPGGPGPTRSYSTRKVDFRDEVRRLTGGAGVQVIYDSVGRTTFSRASIVWLGAA